MSQHTIVRCLRFTRRDQPALANNYSTPGHSLRIPGQVGQQLIPNRFGRAERGGEGCVRRWLGWLMKAFAVMAWLLNLPSSNMPVTADSGGTRQTTCPQDNIRHRIGLAGNVLTRDRFDEPRADQCRRYARRRPDVPSRTTRSWQTCTCPVQQDATAPTNASWRGVRTTDPPDEE